MRSALSHLECSKCGSRYDADAPQQLCRCGAPLLARYDLRSAAQTFTRKNIAAREPSLWRYAELLPLRDMLHRVSLNETMTPLAQLSAFGSEIGLSDLRLKDDGALPTGSFKARGAAIGVSRAKELGIGRFGMPTNGNAGGAWSAYGARAGVEAYIVMPRSAPAIHRLECAMTGAHLFLVNGLIGDAGRIIGKAVTECGLYDASTLKEPYRIEGKKTLGFEIVEQLHWNVPDVLLYPTGGGVGIIGIYKALMELRETGLIGEKLPRMVAVQAEGCAPIVRACHERKRESQTWQDPHTIAFGINVPKALGDFLVLDAIYATGGTAIAVSNGAMERLQRRLAETEGLLICPEGAATLAAAQQLREQGWIAANEVVVAINTGSGLKYGDVPYPQPRLLERDADLPIA
ncbi:MAG TPA: threonine synthase [Candidatus Baltobacteraceae bacterium]|nr:threonine synthase [Candidatus Baltobacteraceae bacterium]